MAARARRAGTAGQRNSRRTWSVGTASCGVSKGNAEAPKALDDRTVLECLSPVGRREGIVSTPGVNRGVIGACPHPRPDP
jgi:hypothetical protein